MVHRGTALFSRDMCVKQISNIVFTLFSKKAKRKPKKGSTMTYTEAVRPHTSSRLREPQTAPAPPRAQSAARLERGPHTHNARLGLTTAQHKTRPRHERTPERTGKGTLANTAHGHAQRGYKSTTSPCGAPSRSCTHTCESAVHHATSSEERGRVPFDPGRREGGCLSAPSRSVRLWRGHSRNSYLSRVYRALSSRL